MISKKLIFFSLALFSILLVLSFAAKADTGAGVRVSLLQNQIISGAGAKLSFEVLPKSVRGESKVTTTINATGNKTETAGKTITPQIETETAGQPGQKTETSIFWLLLL